MRKLIIGSVVAVLVGASGFAAGYWYGGRRYAEQNMALTIQWQAAQKNIAAAENLSHLMRARVALYQAAAELDQRNFGTANAHLQRAVAALKVVDGSAVGIDRADLDGLRDAMAKANINVAVDLEAQRREILDFGNQLDKLMPK